MRAAACDAGRTHTSSAAVTYDNGIARLAGQRNTTKNKPSTTPPYVPCDSCMRVRYTCSRTPRRWLQRCREPAHERPTDASQRHGSTLARRGHLKQRRNRAPSSSTKSHLPRHGARVRRTNARLAHDGRHVRHTNAQPPRDEAQPRRANAHPRHTNAQPRGNVIQWPQVTIC